MQNARVDGEGGCQGFFHPGFEGRPEVLTMCGIIWMLAGSPQDDDA
jgi:hypothetical protein